MSEVREDAVLKAARLGLRLVQPKPDELFIDLDSSEEWDEFEHRLEKFQKLWKDCAAVTTPSSSGKLGHCHVVVKVPELAPLGDHERIALQAALGSDPLREMLAIYHGRAGYKYTSVFFEESYGNQSQQPASLHDVQQCDPQSGQADSGGAGKRSCDCGDCGPFSG